MTVQAASDGLRIWSGIEAQDPPFFQSAYPELLATAELMLKRRKEGFPALVSSGQMTQQEADAEITLFDHIARDWRYIVNQMGEPAPPHTLTARRNVLDQSLAKIAELARQQRGFSESLEHQTQCVIALRWHLEPGRQTIALARLSHQLRANAAAKRREPAHATKSQTQH